MSKAVCAVANIPGELFLFFMCVAVQFYDGYTSNFLYKCACIVQYGTLLRNIIMNVFDYMTKGLHHRNESGVPAVLFASSLALATGFIVGLLFAPGTGKETRTAIVKNTKKMAAKVKKTLTENASDLSETEGE